MIYRGGRRVPPGTYWSAVDGTLVDIKEGKMLPGGKKVLYFRRPAGGAWVVIPAVILLVVLTFPLTSTMGYLIAWCAPVAIVVAGVFFVCGKVVYYGYMSAAEGWEPLKAFFTGKKRRK